MSEKKKPKWAYSEKQLEEDEDKEVDELLQFTSSLDYEKYINDLEVGLLHKWEVKREFY